MVTASACIGHYSGLGCHRHNRSVPGLGTCLGLGVAPFVAVGGGR